MDRPRGMDPGVVMRDGVAYVERVYKSHFSSCPDAKQHRKERS